MIINLRQRVDFAHKGNVFKDIIKAVLVSGVLTYFFYRSIWAFVPMCLPGYFYFLELQGERRRKEEREYVLEFKECILNIATSLRAGYAVENAFRDCEKDMIVMFGEKSRIVREIRLINHEIKNSIPIEALLVKMGERSGIEEITEFSQVFRIAKRSGGNMPEIIHSTAKMIGRRIETEEEIKVFLASKRLQQRIMNVMPMAVIFYMEVTSPGYFDALYHNFRGIALMSLCLLIYLTAYVLSKRILEEAKGCDG